VLLMLSLIPESGVPPERKETGPEAGEPERPKVSFGKLGVVLFLGSETMFFFAIIGAWITLATSKPVAIQMASIALLPHAMPFGLSLLLLAAGSVACYAFKQDLKKAALLMGIAGIAFIAWRILILVQVHQAGHSIRQAVGLAIFYLLTGVHLIHVLAGTIAACLRVAGWKSSKLDALSAFWVHGTLLGAICYAILFLTMGA